MKNMILPLVKRQSVGEVLAVIPGELTCTFSGEHGALGANALMSFDERITLSKGNAYITFAPDDTLEDKAEIYRVCVAKDAIRVGYRDARGAVNGAATVALLLRKDELEVGEILDWPSCSFRSLMIDPSSRVLELEQFKETVRLMALAKYNRLHIHLMDKYGPCYVSKALPDYAYNGPADRPPYTLEELGELADCCKQYAIEVIPEIEIPSHGESLCICYPSFKCQVENAQAWAVCPGSEELYEFIDAQVGELATVFGDSKYFHVGADELEFLDVPNPLICHWNECPRCAALREREGLADVREEFYYIMERCREIMGKYGKKMMMWSDQIDVARPVSLSREILMEFWRVAHPGRGPHEGCSLAGLMEQGFEVVNAYYPYTYTFMEHYLSPEKMKTWTPYTKPEQPAELAAQMKGGEICIWGADPFNFYVTPAALAVFGDKLWALGEREHDAPYRAALAEYLFGDTCLTKVFDCVGDIIPPRTGEFFTYLSPEQIDKALVAACVAALREQKQSYLTRAYIGLLEKIAEGTDTARTQTKKDLEA